MPAFDPNVTHFFPWHHWRHGWYFARVKGTGDVAVKRRRDGEQTGEMIFIPRDEWVKIISSVSRGPKRVAFRKALELHG